MTISTIDRCLAAMLIGGLLFAYAASAADSPHWDKKMCQTCHTDALPVAGSASLKDANSEGLCESCHGERGDATGCRHLSDLAAGDLEMPDSFRDSLSDGAVVCTTCHDIVYQCKNARRQFSYQNPSFLRDRKSLRTGEFCFNCHEANGYKKLSPHKGVAGSPPGPTCLLCHATMPEASDTGQLTVKFNFDMDHNATCAGCHEVRPHPLGMSFSQAEQSEWVHLVAPAADILENMRESRAEFGISLPLDPNTGEIFCATCHNPHDFKVGGARGSQNSGAKHRLRLNNICQACHDK